MRVIEQTRKGGHCRGRRHKRKYALDKINLLLADERRKKQMRRHLVEALRLLDFGEHEPAQRQRKPKRKKERGYGRKQKRGTSYAR